MENYAGRDVRGKWRGRCTVNDCQCHRFSARDDGKIDCSECFHGPTQHLEVKICTERKSDGESCDCEKFEATPDAMNCYTCCHPAESHMIVVTKPKPINKPMEPKPAKSLADQYLHVSSDEEASLESDLAGLKRKWRTAVDTANVLRKAGPAFERVKRGKILAPPKSYGSSSKGRSGGRPKIVLPEAEASDKVVRVVAITFRANAGTFRKLGAGGTAEVCLLPNYSLAEAQIAMREAIADKFSAPLPHSMRERYYPSLNSGQLRAEDLPKLKTAYFYHPVFEQMTHGHCKQLALGEKISLEEFDLDHLDDEVPVKVEKKAKRKKREEGNRGEEGTNGAEDSDGDDSDKEVEIIDNVENRYGMKKRRPLMIPLSSSSSDGESVKQNSAIGNVTRYPFVRPVVGRTSTPELQTPGHYITSNLAPISRMFPSMFGRFPIYPVTPAHSFHRLSTPESPTTSLSNADETLPYGYDRVESLYSTEPTMVPPSSTGGFEPGQTYVGGAVGLRSVAIDLTTTSNIEMDESDENGSSRAGAVENGGGTTASTAAESDPEEEESKEKLVSIKAAHVACANVSEKLFDLAVQMLKVNGEEMDVDFTNDPVTGRRLETDFQRDKALFRKAMDFFLTHYDAQSGKFKSMAMLFKLFEAHCNLEPGRGSIHFTVDRNQDTKRILMELQECVKSSSMRSPAELRKKALVRFVGESGAGPAMVDSFVTMLEQLLLCPYFEGSDDHKIPKKEFNAWIGQFLGHVMGHIMCQGRTVISGLSESCKYALAGTLDYENIHVSVDDLPYAELPDVMRKMLETGSVSLDDVEKELISNALVEQEVGAVDEDSACRLVDNKYRLPKPGREYEVSDSLTRTVVLGNRRASYEYLAKGIQAVCDLRGFVSVGETMHPNPCLDLVLNRFFPSLATVRVNKEDFKKALVVEIGGETENCGDMLVIAKRAMEQLIDSLPEEIPKIGQNMQANNADVTENDIDDYTSVVSVSMLWDWVTARRYKQHQDKVVVEINAGTPLPGFVMRSCLKRLEVSPFHFADSVCIDIFKQALLKAVYLDKGHFGLM